MLLQEELQNTKLPAAQKGVAEVLLKEGTEAKKLTLRELADKSYTSTTTVIRLAQKMGYKGFDDFKDAFVQGVTYEQSHFQNVDANAPFASTDTIQRVAVKVAALTCEAAEDTLSLITHDDLQKAVRLIQTSGHLYLAAISYPLMLGEMFALDLSRIGIPVSVCRVPGEELFLPAVMEKGDGLIVISYSGTSAHLAEMARMAHARGVRVLALTSLGDNPLREAADVVLPLSTREKLYSKIKGYASETSIKLVLDILYSCVYLGAYERHEAVRRAISEAAEPGRDARSDVMKEKG